MLTVLSNRTNWCLNGISKLAFSVVLLSKYILSFLDFKMI